MPVSFFCLLLFFGPLLHHLYPWSGIQRTNQDWKSPLAVIKNRNNKKFRRTTAALPACCVERSGSVARLDCQRCLEESQASAQLSVKESPSDQGPRSLCQDLKLSSKEDRWRHFSSVNISTTLVTAEPVCPLLHPCLHSEPMLRLLSLFLLCLRACVAQPSFCKSEPSSLPVLPTNILLSNPLLWLNYSFVF